jgi:16S rRNA (cytosine1402-N4)-methyltransferase
MEVNAEMQALEQFLAHSLKLLKVQARLVVITYHSLEDRMVKNFMRAGNVEGKIEKDFFGKEQTPFTVITKKAIIPTEAEIQNNTRARSAKLRVAEKRPAYSNG